MAGETGLEPATLGCCYYHLGDFQKGIKHCADAIKFDSQSVGGFNNRGIIYSALKKYDQAIRLNPQYEKAFFNRGTAYSELKKYALAIADYDQAIRLDR